ncbi:MAG: cytochrome b N-terminal domain-containing protein [Burkholderiaceae bacterium]|nr:cytochrome b N-terminal domain-containing protein [Burkholderiaceae bacterium]
MEPNNQSQSPPLGQKLFLALERSLNAVFGDRLNPLYNLGTVAYFLVWIVMLTGLYLYAFFETSVVHAYSSVEAVTHGHFYLGGIIRSLHRYASDALVLVVLLHMARHFVFNRHRGFRWFSWVSGVALLWLTYVSGVNGYMLPWDRLSQFVVTTTTEWMDVLPVIGGSMARNFISNANVSDRLFSLLAFMHIGIPLTLLAVLWVHTQRVPDARTRPPKELAVTLLAVLILLSLVKPALSQAPADMATTVPLLQFDWFYLPVYALIQRWGPQTLWLLVIGATLLVTVLPWLHRRPKSGALQARSLALHPDDLIIQVRAGETLLDAGLREGRPMPYECRNGACGVCKCTVLHGEVRLLGFQPDALTEVERAAGKTLLCCAQPVSDLEISYVPAEGKAGTAVRQYTATVTRMDRLTEDVMQLVLRVEGSPLAYRAGQYINILLPDGSRRSFSFASAPRPDTAEIELQIRHIDGGRFTPAVFETMKTGDRLTFEGPLGAFTLRDDSDKPVIFVAGSTGFAPVKSMVEHAFRTGLQRPMILYWGVRRRRDLYLGDLAEEWAREHANFTFIPVLSEPEAGDHWEGRTGLVHEAILADFPDLSTHQVYACGSVGMVEAAYPAFMARGISSADCFSDAFHLTPHRPVEGAASALVKLGGSHD